MSQDADNTQSIDADRSSDDDSDSKHDDSDPDYEPADLSDHFETEDELSDLDDQKNDVCVTTSDANKNKSSSNVKSKKRRHKKKKSLVNWSIQNEKFVCTDNNFVTLII